MKRKIIKYSVRLVIIVLLLFMLMYESSSDISYLYAGF